jgi:hypothetical protein
MRLEKPENNQVNIYEVRKDIDAIVERYRGGGGEGDFNLAEIDVSKLLQRDLEMWIDFKAIDSMDKCEVFLKKYDEYRQEIGEEKDSDPSRYGFCHYLGNALSALSLEFQIKENQKNEI